MSRNCLQPFVIAVLTGVSTISYPQVGYTQEVKFFCGRNSEGIPTTYARTTIAGGMSRDVPILQWRIRFSEEYTPERRCREVSGRMHTFFNEQKLTILRAGEVRGYPVICVTESRSDSCNSTNVLVTLQSGTNPYSVLARLRGEGNFALDTSVDLKQILKKASN